MVSSLTFYHAQGKFNRQQFDDIFFQKKRFDFSCKLPPGTNQKKSFQNVVCWFVFFDCTTGMCNYYFVNI